MEIKWNGRALVQLENVTSFIDHRKCAKGCKGGQSCVGKTRWHFRKTGYPRRYLPGRPGSAEFMKAYNSALNGKLKPEKKEGSPTRSLSHAIAIYRAHGFQLLGDTTQPVYSRFLDRMDERHGDRPVRGITPKVVRALRNSLSETPTQANRYVSILRLVLAEAVERDWIDANPCTDVKRLKWKEIGHTSWNDRDIAVYMDKYREGTKERLALMLLLCLGQRGSDTCRMGRQHISGDTIRLTQKKTGKAMELWLPPELQKEIARHPMGMTLITTQGGKPYSIKGFQQWFAKTSRAAGLEGLTAHGLRKACARRLAENGATSKQIASVTGHETLDEVQRYTKAANQKRMARDAQAMVTMLVVDGDRK